MNDNLSSETGLGVPKAIPGGYLHQSSTAMGCGHHCPYHKSFKKARNPGKSDQVQEIFYEKLPEPRNPPLPLTQHEVRNTLHTHRRRTAGIGEHRTEPIIARKNRK